MSKGHQLKQILSLFAGLSVTMLLPSMEKEDLCGN